MPPKTTRDVRRALIIRLASLALVLPLTTALMLLAFPRESVGVYLGCITSGFVHLAHYCVGYRRAVAEARRLERLAELVS